MENELRAFCCAREAFPAGMWRGGGGGQAGPGACAGVEMGDTGEMAEDTLLLVSGGAVLGSSQPYGFNVIFSTQLCTISEESGISFTLPLPKVAFFPIFFLSIVENTNRVYENWKILDLPSLYNQQS